MGKELFSFNSEIASHRLILLHGWGADAEDLIPLGQILLKEMEKNIELISLRAPCLHPQGAGRQWYGLFPSNWVEAEQATQDLRIRLNKLASSKIPLEKTVLLGFSQGGAMALAAGASLPLAGLVGCSAYPHPGLRANNNSPPVFLSHGKLDEVVPVNQSKQLFNLFNQKTDLVELHLFDGAHEIPNELIKNIQIFLDKCIK
ncbi:MULTISPECIES: alpha/beta hydrolase [Prochlorococcus]|uniref:Predicted esterase n=1 Tax=Prochlorococcus marinus (strain SARG / CCMP1375 / SS120) TaxID=167539 RepID=Q7VDR9_PROMA|nr:MULTISPECIES: alpha/beta fold hydrolase [Prochlorococcus]AAP99345.1 Predicted esterase [Prochlorococcus marinus subsp. marinus str. CCMP1375]KGG11383.1 Phospholipase/carboxylesterase family protein [Prochlorococcus marinus str. LG]KGG18662.1 Phospholipase/carboxylesterase family protein [Prochlorococcus marinus str. SS2]KGG22935.1 Phospholipase/carboxylesterase family protein [Prochlorococcus marinus str. SS35]KGG34039.1 Phospholipase/carboxylesterase family protein [Prochlorococcus marinus